MCRTQRAACAPGRWVVELCYSFALSEMMTSTPGKSVFRRWRNHDQLAAVSPSTTACASMTNWLLASFATASSNVPAGGPLSD